MVPSDRDEQLARDLRSVRFAIERARTAMVAFVAPRYIEATTRYYDRLGEALSILDGLLADLPPQPPLTPEQEAEAAEWIRVALDRRFGGA